MWSRHARRGRAPLPASPVARSHHRRGLPPDRPRGPGRLPHGRRQADLRLRRPGGRRRCDHLPDRARTASPSSAAPPAGPRRPLSSPFTAARAGTGSATGSARATARCGRAPASAATSKRSTAPARTSASRRRESRRPLQRDGSAAASWARRACSSAGRCSLLQARAAAMRVSRLRPSGVSSYSTRGGFSS